jgi:hypothetical protein
MEAAVYFFLGVVLGAAAGVTLVVIHKTLEVLMTTTGDV